MLYHRLYILLHAVLSFTVTCTVTVLYFVLLPTSVTLLLRLNDKFDDIWTSCGLRRRFRHGYGCFGFYDHSDIMTKMVWSQDGHIERRLLYYEQPRSRVPLKSIFANQFKCITLVKMKVK